MAYQRPIKKPKPLIESRMEVLALLARQDGAEDDHQIALWLIDHHPQWAHNGYQAARLRLTTK